MCVCVRMCMYLPKELNEHVRYAFRRKILVNNTINNSVRSVSTGACARVGEGKKKSVRSVSTGACVRVGGKKKKKKINCMQCLYRGVCARGEKKI